MVGDCGLVHHVGVGSVYAMPRSSVELLRDLQKKQEIRQSENKKNVLEGEEEFCFRALEPLIEAGLVKECVWSG